MNGKINIELSILNIVIGRHFSRWVLETVNFELLTLDETAVHEEPADVLSLVPLGWKIRK